MTRALVLASRDEWLEARRGGIGGSEAPAVWGIKGSPLGLYARKRGLVPEQEDNEDMELGRLLEPVLRQLYERRTGRRVEYPGPHVVHRSERWPWMCVSLDGIAHDEVLATPGPLECKWRSFERWEDGVPLEVQIQVQHALAVTDSLWGSACALTGRTFVWMDIERDEAFIAKHVERCRVLWEQIQAGEPPQADATEDAAEALRHIYGGKDSGVTVELDHRAAKWAATWEEAKEDRDRAEEAARWAESKIRRQIGEARAGRLPDGSLLDINRQRNGVSVLRWKKGK